MDVGSMSRKRTEEVPKPTYHLLPMHPFWEIKQVNTLDGKRFVDWRNAFGGCASGGIWIAFMSLGTWITIHIWSLKRVVGAYVDDSFGSEEKDKEDFYIP